VSRSVAAFHLDKLADAGLVQTRYERLTGRRGPGAGRPAKLYGRSDKELELSLPRRRYALAGSMLADAVSEAGVQGRAVEQTLRDVARDTGARVGAGTGEESPVEPAGPLQTEELLAVLEREGFEPRLQGEEIVLRNCPFHRLAQQQRQLVCGMNLDFLSGLLTGTRSADCFRARLAPEPGYCCVRIDVAGPPA
jgi:predicted ArsR family transcriptional regulator